MTLKTQGELAILHNRRQGTGWMAIFGAGCVAAATASHAQLPPPPASAAPAVRYEYDPRGLETARIRAPGHSSLEAASRRSFDGLSRLRAEVDPLGSTIGLAYDGRDDPIEVRDPRQLATTMFRDGLGRSRQLVSPDTGVTAFVADAAGNVLSSTDARGANVVRGFDALNRVVSASYQAPGAAPVNLGWQYDQTGPEHGFGVGRLTTETYPGGNRRYAYDSQGRVVRISQSNVQADDNPSASRQLLYAYDGAGRVTSMTYPSGRTIHYRHESGLVNSILWSSGSSSQTTLLSGIQHEPFGAPRSWYWQHGSVASGHFRTSDSSGRLTRYPLGTVVRDLTYDAAGRIQSYMHLDRASGVATGAALALNQTFGYDSAGRIVQVAAAGTTWAYAYDANGNRVSAQIGGLTRAITVDGASNRLLAMASPARAFAYDAIGSVTSDTQTPAQWTGAYDARGRLVTTRSTGDGSRFVETAYQYDTNGRRVAKIEVRKQTCIWFGGGMACSDTPGGGGGTQYVYGADGQLIGEYSATSLTEYIWLGMTPVAAFRASAPGWQPQVFYIHADHLDTPRVITDTLGRLRWSWMAEPFGHMLPNDNPQGLGRFSFHLRMPGQYYDSETGLFQNHHRDYDSSLGRYTQSDPIGLAGGINTYSYVEGNPVSYSDPLGLKTFMCTKPLHGLGEKWGPRMYPESRWNPSPAYHQFLCVKDATGKVTCGGQDRSGSAFIPGSPGKPSDDSWPTDGNGSCEPRDDRDCVDVCVIKAVNDPKRPWYAIGFHGTDCQDWADEVIKRCQKQCSAKKK